MSTIPPEDALEPADLSEMAATDALLDRLGARDATADDLVDPTNAALAELLAIVDESREPDLEVGRLAEVLAGRPLYVVGGQSRTIDLTDRAIRAQNETRAQSDESAGPAGPAEADPAPESEPVPETAKLSKLHGLPGVPRLPPVAARSGSLGSTPVSLGARRWQHALTQISLPAASVVLLAAVGSGVSAVVTGNPMAPLDGVSRVMSQLPGVAQLPGVDSARHSLDQVEAEIRQAGIAASRNDPMSASRHLAAARQGLPDVPNGDQTRLKLMIADVQTVIAATTVPGLPLNPPVGVEVTTPPATALTATPSEPPTGTPTVPVPTVEPTKVQPTDVATTPVAPPTSTAPAESAAATTSTQP